MMKLSYIIPTYNATGTVCQTLDSIYATSLTEQEFEVIVVDDCSTDKTCEWIEKYAKQHSNLKLLRQSQNHRQGAARNRGLEIANGEYVTFVDSDDLILDGIGSALKLAEHQKVDLVYCSCFHEKTPTDVVLKEIDMDESVAMSGIDFCEKYQHEGVFWYPWGVLYRRDWLVKLNYPFIADRQHEDRDWLAYVMSHARTITNSKHPMYRYVCNPHSTCRMPRYSTIFDHVASGIRHIDLAQELKSNCPKLSATLYAFGMEEIHHSIRLRNLTKFPWSDNKHLYDNKHLRPLLSDLKRMCRTYPMPTEVRIVAYCPILTKLTTWLASPIATYIRKKKHQ
ncbi:glycosyltransferase family 2 protein [Pseudobutyrivibrio sp.]|uniref:glycosyltransferase family 2 protein n=1 Tax=Pseudobutyrivibrio sp. TaxID=2014367 RepID=UPI0038641A50